MSPSMRAPVAPTSSSWLMRSTTTETSVIDWISSNTRSAAAKKSGPSSRRIAMRSSPS